MYALAEWATPTNYVNQAMVWSRIVQQARAARVKEVVRIEYPYALTDQGAARNVEPLQLYMQTWFQAPLWCLQSLHTIMQGLC